MVPSMVSDRDIGRLPIKGLAGGGTERPWRAGDLMFLDDGGAVPSVKITSGRGRVAEFMALRDVPGVLGGPAEREVSPDRADVATWSRAIGTAVQADKRPLRDFAGTSRWDMSPTGRAFRPLERS